MRQENLQSEEEKMKITKEEVLSALNCCKRQTLEACERCPLQGRCRDGKLLFEACITIIKGDAKGGRA